MRKLFLYLSPAFIAVAIMAVALLLYFSSSFSSVQQTINEFEKLPSVEKVFYSGEGNQILIKCTSGKEVQIKLEDSFSRYQPVVANVCR